jgi:hypothetical protein
MNPNITDLVVNPGESLNLSTIIGIVGGVIGIFGAFTGAYIWLIDRRNMRKATLFFPLFFACQGIVDVINNYEKLGEERSRHLLIYSAKTLDEIVHVHGSIIHFKKIEDINTFFFMKKTIDEKLEFLEQHNWITLKKMFNSDEFKKIESGAKILLLRCSEEEKGLRKVTEVK